MVLHPLCFKDNFHQSIWGGRSLQTLLDKNLPQNKKIGESWEVSSHPHGMSVVSGGAFDGRTLDDLTLEYPEEILGRTAASRSKKFPLLIKLIDAAGKLSLQVHPDDKYAARHGHDIGKTEAWHVIHAKPGSKIICGLKQKMSAEEELQAIEDGSIIKNLHEFQVRPGDSIFVPARTIHALEDGLLVYEVQEASDVTYRIFDWGRTDAEGNPRPLNVKDAIAVTDRKNISNHRTKPIAIKRAGFTRMICAACEYFVMERYEIKNTLEREMADSFDALTVIGGSGQIIYSKGNLPIRRGQTVLLPAGLRKYKIDCTSPITAIVSHVPSSEASTIDSLRKDGFSDEEIKGLGGLMK